MDDFSTSNIVSASDKIGIVKNRDCNAEIKIKGNERIVNSIREFAKYGLITFSREQDFKSSRYTFHFIKPVAKLKQLYNLGDEVLILCCNDSLTSFKSRTKDFIDYILASKAEFKNRLDKITCFLVDDNEDIETIIKKDRIENPDTRLIVPFSYTELENELDDVKLQNKLRCFLYERDLFGVASPLNSDSLFFGKDRTNIISELYGKYRQGEHGGLFGLRRIGKTSILNMLRQRVEQDNGAVIYFDCTKYHHQRWNSFLHQIIRELQEKYTYATSYETGLKLNKDFTIPTAGARYSEARAPLSFEEDLTSLYHGLNNTRILLIFDEIEQVSYTTSPSEHWRDKNDALFFWQALRAISQTDNSVFSFVITGVNPKCIEISKINGSENAIFNVLRPIYISLFTLADVKEMVSGIGGHLGLLFEEEIYTKLIDDYGGHPFLTRQVCSRINSELLERGEERPYTVKKYSYERHAQEYQLYMVGVIEQILSVLQDYYPSEFLLLKLLALDGRKAFRKEIHSGDSAIPHLLGYCLITKDEDDYYIRIRSIEEFLRNKYKYDKSLQTQSEKRARISSRRNDLEEKLREIIFFNLKAKYGSKAKERLIAYLEGTTSDVSQSKKILNASFSDAMKELYFSQLKVILIKDWKNYEALFSDKIKFEQFFNIISSLRVDAHAKEIDEEEEAIINIAFRFFEKALSD